MEDAFILRKRADLENGQNGQNGENPKKEPQLDSESATTPHPI